MTDAAVTLDESLDPCPDCGHDLWLHASGDRQRPQHCRAVTAEWDLLGAGRHGGSVYQRERCDCRHVIDRTEEMELA